ncbi:hypothetical protein TgHK011_007804 [Trichoderma gracile]|nr:hypothetical protein TgHK011_007804 [Trichoderma gracile]
MYSYTPSLSPLVSHHSCLRTVTIATTTVESLLATWWRVASGRELLPFDAMISTGLHYYLRYANQSLASGCIPDPAFGRRYNRSAPPTEPSLSSNRLLSIFRVVRLLLPSPSVFLPPHPPSSPSPPPKATSSPRAHTTLGESFEFERGHHKNIPWQRPPNFERALDRGVSIRHPKVVKEPSRVLSWRGLVRGAES